MCPRLHLGVQPIHVCLELVLGAEADDLAFVGDALFELLMIGLRIALGLGNEGP